MISWAFTLPRSALDWRWVMERYDIVGNDLLGFEFA